MSPHSPQTSFVESYIKLLSDADTANFQKLLEMKVCISWFHIEYLSHLLFILNICLICFSCKSILNYGITVFAINTFLIIDRCPRQIKYLLILINLCVSLLVLLLTSYICWLYIPSHCCVTCKERWFNFKYFELTQFFLVTKSNDPKSI